VLAKDVWNRTPNSSTFLYYKDRVMNQEISFGANTKGFFLIPVPLKSEITIDYTVNLQTMDRDGSMGPVLFADSPNDCWFIDWVTIRAFSPGRAVATQPSPIEERRQSANMWFDKVNMINMKVKVVADEEEEGKSRLFVYYNDESQPSNVSGAFPSDVSGFVGFRWYRTKVNIKNLRITGILDKGRALELLKRQGVKVGSAKADTDSSARVVRSPAASDASKDARRSSGNDRGSRQDGTSAAAARRPGDEEIAFDF
jgi:hypothetical protein